MPRARSYALLFASFMAAALIGGCQYEPQLSYQEAYEQKLYTQALDKATPIATDERANDRQRAALVAGMSAHSLGKNADAKKWLIPLKYSTDQDVAARARATLGIIAKGEGKPAEAATLLSDSADKLEGNDAAKAKIIAGDAYRQLGMESKAREEYNGAQSEAEDPALKAAADQKARPMSYFVQCGAFSTRLAAEKQQRAVRAQAVNAGQPAPLILQLAPNGTPLFVVQIGPYPDMQQAQRAKAQMNLASAAVTKRQ